MPVLARLIEAAGIPTVTVTMMPALAERLGAPRIVGVEFPFAHNFGLPGDRAMQRRVLSAASQVLAGSPAFGARLDLDTEWPISRAEAYRSWQPKEAAPIVRQMLERQKNRPPAD